MIRSKAIISGVAIPVDAWEVCSNGADGVVLRVMPPNAERTGEDARSLYAEETPSYFRSLPPYAGIEVYPYRHNATMLLDMLKFLQRWPVQLVRLPVGITREEAVGLADAAHPIRLVRTVRIEYQELLDDRSLRDYACGVALDIGSEHEATPLAAIRIAAAVRRCQSLPVTLVNIPDCWLSGPLASLPETYAMEFHLESSDDDGIRGARQFVRSVHGMVRNA